MKCVLIGGTGLIGRPLAVALLKQGYEVTILTRDAKKRSELQSSLPKAEWLIGDLHQSEVLKLALNKADIVFHLASSVNPQTSNDNPILDIESNLIGSLNLLEQARLNRVKKIIFVSSGGAVYGIPQMLPIPETHPTQPLSSYGIVKLAIEKYLYLYHHIYGLDYCVLRVANAYGNLVPSNQNFGAVDTFVQQALKNEAIDIWGDGLTIRDYIHVDDIVNALLLTISYQGSEKIFNIGSGSGISLNELIVLIEMGLKHQFPVNYLKGRAVDVPANILDTSLAKLSLQWAPQISLPEGIRSLIQYWQVISGQELL
ncbi:MAG: NAD-dependent epimerase/dehydratase family protein [Gammaproteobacteria bacterium]|nr:NAD-dependent epimerase/dehydratase family protein [Gammaproteobacteria bacterium]